MKYRMLTYSTLIGQYDNQPSRLTITDYPKELENLSDRRKSRYYKINSHLIEPHHQSLYMDACLIKTAPPPKVRADIAVFQHPNRQCLYSEAETCKRLNLGNHEQIDKQMEKYKKLGFPKNFGLGENCYIIRKNNDKVKRFNEIWWEEYINGSERDQLSFMFAIWKSGVILQFLKGHSRKNIYYNNWGEHLNPRTSQENVR